MDNRKTVRKRFNIKKEGKIRYFFNATLYIYWLSKVKQERIIHTVVFFIINNLVRIFGTKSFYEKMINRQKASEEQIESIFFGKNSVKGIGSDRILMLIYFGYGFLISFPFLGIYMRYVSDDFTVITLIVPMIPFLAFMYFTDRMTQKGEIYLKYFKHFDKEDRVWRKKWSIISFLFILGSIVSCVLGIRIAFVIVGALPLIPEW